MENGINMNNKANNLNELSMDDQVLNVDETQTLLKDSYDSNTSNKNDNKRRDKLKIKPKRRDIKGFTKMAKFAASKIKDKFEISLVSFIIPTSFLKINFIHENNFYFFFFNTNMIIF